MSISTFIRSRLQMNPWLVLLGLVLGAGGALLALALR